MKKIERYDTTSIMVEIPHHLIRTREEFDRATSGDGEIVQLGKYIDPENYHPYIRFMVRDTVHLASGWFYYVVPIELSSGQSE